MPSARSSSVPASKTSGPRAVSPTTSSMVSPAWSRRVSGSHAPVLTMSLTNVARRRARTSDPDLAQRRGEGVLVAELLGEDDRPPEGLLGRGGVDLDVRDAERVADLRPRQRLPELEVRPELGLLVAEARHPLEHAAGQLHRGVLVMRDAQRRRAPQLDVQLELACRAWPRRAPRARRGPRAARRIGEGPRTRRRGW